MEKPKKTKRSRKSKKKTSEVEQASARALLELKGVEDEEPSPPPLSFSELGDYLEFGTPEYASAPSILLEQPGNSGHQFPSQSTADQLLPSSLQAIDHHHHHPHTQHHLHHNHPTTVRIEDNEHRPRKKRKKQAMVETVVDPELMRNIDVVDAYVNGASMVEIERPVVDLVDELIQHPPTDDDDLPMHEAAETLPDLPALPTTPASASSPAPDPAIVAPEEPPKEPPAKRQRTKRRPKAPQQVPGQPPPSGGTFTAEELQAIDDYFVQYRRNQNPPLTHEELCQRVWANNRAKDSFWDSVCQVLPNRPKASIYKHIRRTYHIYLVRGKWTSEDDESLKNLVEEKGRVWKVIGKELERMPEDCRDRWRNYVKCGDKRGQNTWTPAEEQKLRDAVDSCLTELLKDKQVSGKLPPPNSDETAEERDARIEREKEALHDDINWTIVSDKMDGWRSRIQCRYKWNKMKSTPEEPPDASNETNSQPATSKVFKKQDLQTGDQIWLMSEIIKQGYMVYKKIDWNALSKLDPLNNWLAEDLKTTFTRLRSMIRLHTRMSVQEIAKQILTDLQELPGDVRNKRTEGKAIQAKAAIRKAMKAQAARDKATQAQATEDEATQAGAETAQEHKPRKRRKRARSKKYVDEIDLSEDGDELHAQAIAGGVVMYMPNLIGDQEVNMSSLGETAKAAMQYFDHGRLIDEDYDAEGDNVI